MATPKITAVTLLLLAGPAHARPQMPEVGGQVLITEFAYAASSGEFVELTNVGAAPIDLTGWSIDDVEGVAGAFDLSAAGTLGPGESCVVTTEPAAAFRAAWSITANVAVLGDNDSAKLSRQDTIHLFDHTAGLVDRLAFGDLAFEYTVRGQDVAAYPCPDALGTDNIYGWRAAALGDSQASSRSTHGDLGSPGRFSLGTCPHLPIGTVFCLSNPNSTGSRAELSGAGTPNVVEDNFELVAELLPPSVFGLAAMSQTRGFTVNPGGSSGVLCLGGSLHRRLDTIRTSDQSGSWGAPLALGSAPGVLAGSTWSFQLWFRDNDPTPTSNFTSAVEVNFR